VSWLVDVQPQPQIKTSPMIYNYMYSNILNSIKVLDSVILRFINVINIARSP